MLTLTAKLGHLMVARSGNFGSMYQRRELDEAGRSASPRAVEMDRAVVAEETLTSAKHLGGYTHVQDADTAAPPLPMDRLARSP
jgi:hypothetical protein